MSENNSTEGKFSYVATAEATDLHRNMHKWMLEETGVDYGLEAVKAVCLLRGHFQLSEANQVHLAERRKAATQRQAQLEKSKRASKIAQLAKLQAELAPKPKAAKKTAKTGVSTPRVPIKSSSEGTGANA